MDPWQAYIEDGVTRKDRQPVKTIIDAHTHIGLVRHGELPVTAERLVEYMDAHGIDQAILFPLESPGGSARYVTTDDVLAAAAKYPDRLIPWGSVDPRMYLKHDDNRYFETIEHYLDRGIRGFGELKCALPIDHERMQLLYRICDHFDLPILIHVDDVFATDDIGLPNLERMLQTYPTVDFIFHSHGWWAHISADVTADELGSNPDRPVEPGGRADDLLGEYDNCYGDFSMGSGFTALSRDEVFTQGFLERHHDSLIFGSDYLFPGQTVPQFGLFERFDLPDEHWEDIWYRTIKSLMH